MLEQRLQELFEQQAADLPLAQASVAAAASQGRAYRAARHRRRRLVTIAAPVLAAAAVLAVTVTPAFSHRTPAPRPPAGRAHHHRPGHSLPLAPREFSPLLPYATFGWLPAGARPTDTNQSHTVEFLDAVGADKSSWQLAVFDAGDCSLRSALMTCRDLTSAQNWTATQSAPSVDGFPAYWDFPSGLIFEYARGGWATLTLYGPHNQTDAARAMALHIARALRFAAPSRATRFPAELAGLSAGWAVRSVLSAPSRYGPLEFQYQIARGSVVSEPWFGNNDIANLSIAPASQRLASCHVTPGQSQQLTVAGHQVIVTSIPAGDGEAAEHDLCTSNDDGLSVDVLIIGGGLPVDVTALFEDLRLLGPDPAHWTTKPIG
jgi:hypothetical protein